MISNYPMSEERADLWHLFKQALGGAPVYWRWHSLARFVWHHDEVLNDCLEQAVFAQVVATSD